MSRRQRLLAVSWPGFAAGPQRGLDDLLLQPVWEPRFEVEVWRPGDCYRGLTGKWRLACDVAAVLARETREPVLYVNRDAGFAFWLVLVARALGSRAIAVHAKSALFPWPQRPLLRRLAQWTLRRLVPLRIAVSDPAALSMFGDRAGVRLMPCAIDFGRLQAEAGESPRVHGERFRFACIGRLAPEKGFNLALRAFARINADAPPELLLVGEGGERTALEALAVDLGVASSVHFHGPAESIGAIYAHHCDAVLVPSHVEAQGRVVAEAQFFGLPVIVSPAVPADAALDPAALRRTRGWEVDDWAEVMRSVMDGPGADYRSSEAGPMPESMRNLDARHRAGELADWLDALVPAARPVGPLHRWMRRVLARAGSAE